jgi:SAM-dependent methyltransferase
MNGHVSAFLETLKPSSLSALEISGAQHQDDGWRTYRIAAYPEFDICDPNLDLGEAVDLVIAEQVLEHVVDPCAALRNMFRYTRAGGTLVITTPFLVKVHRIPEDYWRFTEEGLRVLLEGAGWENVETYSWGNRACVKGNFKRWAAVRPWLSMRNEEDFPVSVWAYARKPT